MASCYLEVVIHIFNENKAHHQRAETDAKILVCLGCLKTTFHPKQGLSKVNTRYNWVPTTVPPPNREVALDPGVTLS